MSKGGTLLTMILDGGKKEVFKMLNNLEIIDISNNLGDTKSLITHPATTTHYSLGEEGRKEAGIPDGMIRLSVGLENPTDLIDDLEGSKRTTSIQIYFLAILKNTKFLKM